MARMYSSVVTGNGFTSNVLQLDLWPPVVDCKISWLEDEGTIIFSILILNMLRAQLHTLNGLSFAFTL